MRHPRRLTRLVPPAIAASLLGACHGPQSALDPAGRDAEVIANLFGWMSVGTVIAWSATMALFAYAMMWRREPMARRTSARVIGIGGVVLPAIALTVLLIRGLSLM